MLFPFRLKYVYFKPVHATVAIGGLLVILFVLQLADVIDVHRWGLLDGEGQPERLISHTLLHGGWVHLATNIIAFFVFGQVVNAALGTTRFLAVCAVCGLSSALLELMMDDSLAYIPTVGFSGVIMGLIVIGAFWIPKVKVTFFFWFILLFGFISFPIWAVAGTFVIFDLGAILLGKWWESGVAHWGHLGGALGGGVCLLVLRAFRAVDLKGFLVGSEMSKSKSRLARRLRARRKEAPEGAPEALGARCLRCGFHFILREPPAEKGLRCGSCGLVSKDIRKQPKAGEPEAPVGGGKACLIVLSGLAVVLFVAGYLVMRT